MESVSQTKLLNFGGIFNSNVKCKPKSSCFKRENNSISRSLFHVNDKQPSSSCLEKMFSHSHLWPADNVKVTLQCLARGIMYIAKTQDKYTYLSPAAQEVVRAINFSSTIFTKIFKDPRSLEHHFVTVQKWPIWSWHFGMPKMTVQMRVTRKFTGR